MLGKRGVTTRWISVSRVIAIVAAPVAFLVLAILYVVVVAVQGRPFLFVSERMRTPETPFRLYKIRTMRPARSASEEVVLCGHQARRITPIGAFLRRTRLDELPQIINVLKGDIRFIGPRPPLRRYVEAYPDLYREVLCETPPGITGLATVTVHRREERILARCIDPCEADRIYRERCIPVKARLDLIYRRRRGPWLNLMILFRTLSRLSVRPQLRTARTRVIARTPSLTAVSAISTMPTREREAA